MTDNVEPQKNAFVTNYVQELEPQEVTSLAACDRLPQLRRRNVAEGLYLTPAELAEAPALVGDGDSTTTPSKAVDATRRPLSSAIVRNSQPESRCCQLCPASSLENTSVELSAVTRTRCCVES